MSIGGFYSSEGMTVLVEELDELLEHGWFLDCRFPDWGTARVFKPLPKMDRHAIGYTVMPVKPTARHALSNPSNDQEEQLVRAGETNRKLSTLTTEERQVLLLCSKHYTSSREIQVPVDEVARLLDGGWYLVRQEAGVATLSGEFVTEMTQCQVGELLGMSQVQVHRRLRSAYYKLGRAA